MSGADSALFGDVLSGRSMTAHHSASSGNDEWLTPPHVVAALGVFDLDPCSPGDRRPWDTAARHLSAEDDGLRHEWSGRVWLNPPYSTAGRWVARLADHGCGTALLFARTETAMWHEHIWPRCSGVLFLRGRLSFHRIDGKRAQANSGAPSALIAYGRADAAVLASLPLPGVFVTPTSPTDLGRLARSTHDAAEAADGGTA